MNAKKAKLEKMAETIHRHGNIRIGKANADPSVKVGFYIGPNLQIATRTKSEMYYYLSGRILGRIEG